MSIKPISPTTPIISRIKQTVSTFGLKLKTLVSDVFQREEKPF